MTTMQSRYSYSHADVDKFLGISGIYDLWCEKTSHGMLYIHLVGQSGSIYISARNMNDAKDLRATAAAHKAFVMAFQLLEPDPSISPNARQQ